MTAPLSAGGHSPATVEKAARAMFVRATHDQLVWETVGVAAQEQYLGLAAAALSVVPAAPDDGLRAAVLALHRPWYEAGGVRHDNTVTVSCPDFPGCDGTSERHCPDGEDDGHEVLACYECRCIVDYDLDGFLLWPCPTARAAAGAVPDGTGEQETPEFPCGWCNGHEAHRSDCPSWTSR